MYIIPIMISFVFGNVRSMKIFFVLIERHVFMLKQIFYLISQKKNPTLSISVTLSYIIPSYCNLGVINAII